MDILDGDRDGANEGKRTVPDQAGRTCFLIVNDHWLPLKDRLLKNEGQIDVLLLGHLMFVLLLQEFGCAAGCYKTMNEDDEEENGVEYYDDEKRCRRCRCRCTSDVTLRV